MLNTLLIVLAVTTPVAPRCLPNVQPATAQLKVADAAAARRDYRVADAALDTGLHELGNGYAPPPTNDDTGMHLVVANSQRSRGKLKLAVELKRRVLAERLGLCGKAGGQ